MNILNKFFAMSAPWRIALGALMLFLAGPALLGLISEYATYWYALSEGVRPPVEGIPYLNATVTATSLALALLVSLTFIATRFIIGRILFSVIFTMEGSTKFPSAIIKLVKRFIYFDSTRIDAKIKEINKAHEQFRETSWKNVFISIIVFCSITSIILYFIIPQESKNAISTIIFVNTYFAVTFLTLWRKVVMQIVSFIAAISFYVFSISLLFSNEHYSQFLLLTGFGGGQPITIQLEEGKPSVDMNLILRSRDWLIGRSPVSGNGFEIPQHAVKSIEYNSQSLILNER